MHLEVSQSTAHRHGCVRLYVRRLYIMAVSIDGVFNVDGAIMTPGCFKG